MFEDEKIISRRRMDSYLLFVISYWVAETGKRPAPSSTQRARGLSLSVAVESNSGIEKGYGKNILTSISMLPGFPSCQLSSPVPLTFRL